MPLNNRPFGKAITRGIVESVYFENTAGAGNEPPPPSFLLIADNGDQLITDTEQSLITDGGI